jgi:DNA mismatch endonuclease (patch repair protein)
MAAIGPKDTEPELIVRRFLHLQGFRFRLHRKDLPGRPDIVLPRYRSVVMVHGCFWHHHGCKNSVWPKTRREFWRAKIGATVKRDRRNARELAALGWRVIVVWECCTRPRAALMCVARQLHGVRS